MKGLGLLFILNVMLLNFVPSLPWYFISILPYLVIYFGFRIKNTKPYQIFLSTFCAWILFGIYKGYQNNWLLVNKISKLFNNLPVAGILVLTALIGSVTVYLVSHAVFLKKKTLY